MSVVANLVIAISAKTTEFEKSLQGMEKTLARSGAQLQRVGGDLTRGVTLPLGIMAGAAIKAATDFESSFAGVRKTVAGVVDSKGDITAFGTELRQSFRDLAKEIPLSVNELNKIGEMAGQLGIKSGSIIDFTKVIAEMAVSTNLSAEQAAEGMAKFANVTQMPMENLRTLGSVIVFLGNELVTSESQILEFGQNIAGSLHQLGFAEHQILAIAAAFASAGIEAEAGATAVQKAVGSMNTAVLTGKGLDKFAAASGMPSGDAFKALFRSNPSEALTKFVEGVGAAGMEGELVLRAVGIDDARQIRAFTNMAASGDLFRHAMELANLEVQRGTALSKEAEQRYRTFESQLQLVKNVFYDIAITVGDQLIESLRKMAPAMTSVADAVSTAVSWFSKLPESVQTGTFALLGFAAAAGPVMYVVGTLKKATSGFLALIRLIPGVTTAAATASTLLSGAWTAVVAAGAAVVAPLVAWGAAMVAMNVAANSDTFLHWASTADQGLSGLAASLLRAAFGYDKLTEAQFNQANARRKGETGGVGDIPGLPDNPFLRSTAPALSAADAQKQMTDAETRATQASAALTAQQDQHAESIKNLRKELTGVSKITAAKDMAAAMAGADWSKVGDEAKDQISGVMDDAIKVLKLRGEKIPAAIQDTFNKSFRGVEIDMSGLFPDMSKTFENDTAMAEGVAKAYEDIGTSVDMTGLDFSDGTEKAKEFNDALDDMGASLQALDAAAKEARDGALKNLAGSFESMGSAIGGTAGGFVAQIGAVASGLLKFTGASTGFINGAAAVVEGAALIWQATDPATHGGGAAGLIASGALTGFSIGMNPALMAATGGMSAGIGAGVGALVGWARSTGADDDEKAAREAVGQLHDAIVEQFEGFATAGMVLEAGSEQWRQVNVAVREAYLAMGSTEAEAMADLAAVNDASHHSAEAVEAAARDIEAAFEGVRKAYEDWNQGVALFNKGLDIRVDGFAAHAELVKSLGMDLDRSKKAATDKDTTVTQGDLIAQTIRLKEETGLLSAEFQRVGQYAVMAFSQTLANTMSLPAALEAVAEPLRQLQLAQDSFGFKPSAGVGRLLEIQGVVDENRDVFDSMAGLNMMMEGLGKTSLLTKEDVALFGTDATGLFNTLTGRGIDANMAMALMQPTLQKLWEHQEKFGVFTDIGTQALIDQAAAAGVVGDDQRSALDQVLQVLVAIGEALGANIPDSLRRFRDASVSAAADAEAALSAVGDSPTISDQIATGAQDAADRITSASRAGGSTTTGTSMARGWTYAPEGDSSMFAAAVSPFASLVPSFANEGFVRRPTLAMIGDAPGGEYVLHKSTVEGLVGGRGRGNLTVKVVLQGGINVGSSQEFEDTVTRAVNKGIQRSGEAWGTHERIVKQMVRSS